MSGMNPRSYRTDTSELRRDRRVYLSNSRQPQPYTSIIPTMNWWLWLAGGLALVVAELVTPSGFFIIFFGLGALTVGVLATLEILTSGWAQWLRVHRLVGGVSGDLPRPVPGAFRDTAATERGFAGWRPGHRAGTAAARRGGQGRSARLDVERAEHQHRDARCRPAGSCCFRRWSDIGCRPRKLKERHFGRRTGSHGPARVRGR